MLRNKPRDQVEPMKPSFDLRLALPASELSAKEQLQRLFAQALKFWRARTPNGAGTKSCGKGFPIPGFRRYRFAFGKSNHQIARASRSQRIDLGFPKELCQV